MIWTRRHEVLNFIVRAYFKNDLYNYTLLKEQTANRDKLRADLASKNKPAVTRPKKQLPVDETLTINISKEVALLGSSEKD